MTDRKRTRTGDYDVGYRRPPKKTQFSAGKSGNPKGRPKGRKNLVTIFNETLNEKIEIQENGKMRKISRREAIVKRVVNQAIRGDIKAMAFVLAKEPEMAREIAAEQEIPRDASPEEAMKAYMRLIAAPRKRF